MVCIAAIEVYKVDCQLVADDDLSLDRSPTSVRVAITGPHLEAYRLGPDVSIREMLRECFQQPHLSKGALYELVFLIVGIHRGDRSFRLVGFADVRGQDLFPGPGCVAEIELAGSLAFSRQLGLIGEWREFFRAA